MGLVRANAPTRVTPLPTAALYESIPRHSVGLTNQAVPGLSGRLWLHAIYLPAATLITSITYVSATTGATLPTNQWFALYDSSRNLLAQTVDDTTTAWAAGTPKTLAFASPFTTTYSGIYYLGIMVAATTVPSLYAISSAAGTAVLALPPIATGTSTTGLTTTAPNPAAAITVSTAIPYAYVS